MTGPTMPRSGTVARAAGGQALPAPPVPVRATCRLQMSAAFRLDDARAIVPYLAMLGASHVYLSPILRSRAGSTHGYDVADPTQLDPELGDDRALAALVATLRTHGMGVLLDIVPNHMATGHENPAWDELLMHGRAARHAAWFDVDWYDPHEDLRGRVFVPVLGQRVGDAVAAREIHLEIRDGAVRVRYYTHDLPLDPRTAPRVFASARAGLAVAHGAAHPDVAALDAVLDGLRALPPRDTPDTAARGRRLADAARLATELRALMERAPLVAAALTAAAAGYHEGDEGPARMRRLLDAQPYALAYWRRAAREINYRRFFNIDELVGLRTERATVFDETHARILDWVGDGTVDALRVDHVDGLRDPQAYLERLTRVAAERRGAPVPVYVEKIVLGDEVVRSSWPVAGTTGYEALNFLEALFVDADGMDRVAADYAAILGRGRGARPFEELAHEAKRLVLGTSLASDLSRLTRLLEPVVAGVTVPGGPAAPDRQALEGALAEVIAAMPVYRTYLRPGDAVHDDDQRVLDTAFAIARQRAVADPGALDLLDRALVPGDTAPVLGDDVERDRQRFVSRFQQVTSPAAAKGVEDTALYRRVPLVSRNEVGGDPDHPVRDAVTHFHATNADRAAHWPRGMIAVTTHDTKRSADTRARLDVLSETPDRWRAAVAEWRAANGAVRARAGRRMVPDVNTEYLLYQSLLGIWPVDGAPGPQGAAAVPDAVRLEEIATRTKAYMRKAIREGRERSSWVEPDEAFETALDAAVDAMLDPQRSAPFLASIDRFAREIAPSGWWNALSRTLLQYTMPGVPDLYQGDELWMLALVDPDNRRPVDFVRRAAHLAELERGWHADNAGRHSWLGELVAHAADGRIKQHVVHRALQARRARPALFAAGSYEPLEIGGAHADRVVAFARRAPDGEAAIVVAPRLVHTLTGGAAPVGEVWDDCWVGMPPGLESRTWRCQMTGSTVAPRFGPPGTLPVRELLNSLPVALLGSDAR